jgi:hypothetical protein
VKVASCSEWIASIAPNESRRNRQRRDWWRRDWWRRDWWNSFILRRLVKRKFLVPVRSLNIHPPLESCEIAQENTEVANEITIHFLCCSFLI